MNSVSRKNSSQKFSTKQKNLCYYPGLILLSTGVEIFRQGKSENRLKPAVNNGSSYFVKRQ
jgi:hypothetical protein